MMLVSFWSQRPRQKLVYDAGKPDGTPMKLFDVSRLTGFGWKAGIELEEGLWGAYRWLLDSVGSCDR